MSPRSRVTIRDVAAHAGVSHQTVSRVINNHKRVTPETRSRVKSAIAELGYRPNAIARSMALGRTCMISCIAPNLTDFTFGNIFEGAEAKAHEHGYFVIISSAGDLDEFRDIVTELIDSRRVPGMIVINPYIDERYTLIPENFPVVFVGSRPRELEISSVTLNDELAAYEATAHLIGLGHRNIAMITGPMIEDCSQDRCRGFEKALQQAGIDDDPSMVLEGDWSATSGQDALMRLAEVGQIPTAIFAQNDLMAIGVIQAARKIGLNVPTQLSVIGVDDIPLASYFDPALTTMRQNIQQIGQEAARLLIEKIENPYLPRQTVSVNAHLVVRNSTRPIEI